MTTRCLWIPEGGKRMKNNELLSWISFYNTSYAKGLPHGYGRFLEIIMDPSHDQYGEMTAWADADFDPERFDCKTIRFDNPAKRLKRAMG